MMKKTKIILYGTLMAAIILTGCRSRQEAAGDKYRKANDPLRALMQYEEALKRGKVSKEFAKNYALVNIQAMAMRSKEDPTAEFLDILKDTVASLLNRSPDPENTLLFVQTLQEIGMQRLKVGTAQAAESGFQFLQTAQTVGGKSPEIEAKIASVRNEYLSNKLKEVESDIKDAASEPTAGIVADYKMNKLAIIMGGETAEMRTLWSQIRKLNLNTYLMYDNDDVDIGERPDFRINKYGILLGIVKLEATGTSAKVQLKAFNGSSGPIHFTSEGFTLVDRQGNVFKPTAKIGNFSDKTVVGKGDESKTGGLTFTYPDGTEPFYIEFNSESGVSRKYLP